MTVEYELQSGAWGGFKWLKVGVWQDEGGKIKITVPGDKFIQEVTDREGYAGYHPGLYKEFKRLLQTHGAWRD